MDPIDFKFRNMMLGAPKGMSQEECRKLPVWHDGKTFMSVWQLSPEEIEKVAKTGQIFLVVYGNAHPPVLLSAESILDETLHFNVGDQIFCKVYIPGDPDLIEASGIIELNEGTYFVNTGKTSFPMAYVREVTIIGKDLTEQ